MAPKSGGVDRYVLFGHPVAQSRSPFIHGMFAKQESHALTYKLVDVSPEAFRGEALRFFVEGGAGANVTVPHKQAAAELVNVLSPRAERAGAVNTLVPLDNGQLRGENTDGVGLKTDLTVNLKLSLAGQRILVLGAGGATRGILESLLECQPSLVVVANRTASRALDAAAAFKAFGPIEGCGYNDLPGLGRFDLILNATSASLAGELPPVAPGNIARDTVCYDLAYSRGDTPFTAWAKQREVERTYKGWGMLVEQAAAAYALWRGVRPETAPVLRALTEEAPVSIPFHL